MKRIITLTFISLLFASSCKHDPTYSPSYTLDICLANMTNYNMSVTLYPTSQYNTPGNLYLAMSPGGGYAEKTFTIQKCDSLNSWGSRVYLFYTNDTSITPSCLLRQVFDSISIVVNNDSNLTIRFNHNKIYNYSENPFSLDSIWYFKRYIEACDGWNPDHMKDYTYSIDKHKLKK